MASQTLTQAPVEINRLKVHAVCGPATGKGLFENSGYTEWESDGITDGRIIFVSGADDSGPNVIFRDASGTYTNSLLDEAEVTLTASSGASGAGMWTIFYPATGVTEAHNLITKDGRLIDLWTVNKPSLIIGASAKIFISNCVRP